MINRRDFVIAVVADVRGRAGDIGQPENIAQGVAVPIRCNGKAGLVTVTERDLKTAQDVSALAKRCVDMAAA